MEEFSVDYASLDDLVQLMTIDAAPRIVIEELEKVNKLQNRISKLCGELNEVSKIWIHSSSDAHSSFEGRVWPNELYVWDNEDPQDDAPVEKLSEIMGRVVWPPTKISINASLTSEQFFELCRPGCGCVEIFFTTFTPCPQFSEFAHVFESAAEILVNMHQMEITTDDMIQLTEMKSRVPITEHLYLVNVSPDVDLNAVINLYKVGFAGRDAKFTIAFKPMQQGKLDTIIKMLKALKQQHIDPQYETLLFIEVTDSTFYNRI